MANDPDYFTISTSADQTYIEMNKVRSAFLKKVTVTSVSKVFTYKSDTLQAVIFVNKLPIQEAKRRLNQTVRRYAQNIAKQQADNVKARKTNQ